MSENILKYLNDILISIVSIEDYLGEKRDFNVYRSDKMLRRATERELEIIGEAMSRIRKEDDSFEISSMHAIIGMRNRVIHGYDLIDNELVWGAVVKHLPILKKEIQSIFQEYPSQNE
jgi:uncharacterized protein with HEPN domain